MDGNHGCHADAQCNNHEGAENTCTCNTGFFGDGKQSCQAFTTCGANTEEDQASVEATETTDGTDRTCTCQAHYGHETWHETTTGNVVTCSDINECATNPCENGGICSESSTHATVGLGLFYCECAPGFDGHTCNADIDECATTPCHNGGACTDSTDDPSVAVTSFQCNCVDGWSGTDCSVDVNECASNPCLNDAQCKESSMDSSVPINSFHCECADGYEGTLCSTDTNDCAVDPSTATPPCQNGGTCTDHVGGFTCECAAGWSGTTCATDVNECATNPCMHGACHHSATDPTVAHGQFRCDCAHGWDGTQCDHNIDDCTAASCYGHGTCTDTGTGHLQVTCACDVGWEGAHCEDNINDCTVASCHGHGTCTDTGTGHNEVTCACVAGWEGAHCEVDIDECAATTTNQQYELVASTKCQAANGQDWQQFYKNSGFNQATCQDWCDETNRMTPGDCVAYGMGIRSDLVTACMIYLRNGATDPRSLTGVSDTVGPVAATAATAADGTQRVVSKTSDRNWECRKNVATTTTANPCHNDGTCTNHNGGFSCACNAGWEGAHCEVDIDECAVTTTSQRYELVTQTKCQAANGRDWQQFYKTSGFNQARCQDWCDETNRRTPGDCVAYGMGIRSDLVTACMIYLRNGAADPRSLTGVRGTLGPVAATAATAADGTQHVVSKTWDRNWECRKNVVTTTANACHNHGACTNQNGGFGCACTGSWSGDTCSTYTALRSRWWFRI